MKCIIVFFLISYTGFCSSAILKDSTITSDSNKVKKNSIQIELLGNGFPLSISYERNIFQLKSITGRVRVGGLILPQSYGAFVSIFSELTCSYNNFEFGVGCTYFKSGNDYANQLIFIRLGHRSCVRNFPLFRFAILPNITTSENGFPLDFGFRSHVSEKISIYYFGMSIGRVF